MKCPGQDSRYWRPGDIFEAKCPECGNEVEFFKDDSARVCKKCGHRFLNPAMDFGCASYCKYAEQCLGSLSPELLAQREDLLKDRVAVEVKRHLKQDFKGIGRAVRTARYAEEIGKEERGDLAVILTTAYLHGLGAVVAREILTDLGASEELLRGVCDLIGDEHDPERVDSVNYRAVHDAELIANLEERHKEVPLPEEELIELLENSFLTDSGRRLARKRLSQSLPA